MNNFLVFSNVLVILGLCAVIFISFKSYREKRDKELLDKEADIKTAYEHAVNEMEKKINAIKELKNSDLFPEGVDDLLEVCSDRKKKIDSSYLKELRKHEKEQSKFFKSALKEKWNKNPIRRALTKFKNTVIKRKNIGTVNQARWLYKLVTVEELEE